MRPLSLVLLCLLPVLAPGTAWAAAGDLFRDFGPLERLRDAVDVHADQIEYREAEGRIVASGAVRLDVGDRHLAADEVSVDVEAQTVAASGHVLFAVGSSRLEGDRIEYNYRTNQGVITNGRGLIDPGISFSGAEIRQEGEHVFSFTNGSFTTCRACQPEPTVPWWEFRAERGTIYQDDWITARNASVWFKGVPALYSPVLALPIGPRRTGFLFPVVGYGNTDGFTYKQPFFWAISRSQDALITPMYRTSRGFELDAEYRYVLDERSAGSLSGRYLNDQKPQGAPPNRGEIRWNHNQAFSPEWTFKADAHYQTDTSINRAFIDTPSAQRTQRIDDSNVFVTQTTPQYVFLSLLESTQDLGQTQIQRVSRIPEFRFQWLPAPILDWPLVAEGESSAVLFQRTDAKGTGRVDLFPTVHLPLALSPWLTATTSVGLRETAYTSALQPSGETNRFLVEAGETLGSRFLRRFENPGFGFLRLTHVVEPSVQYLYVPWVHQQSFSQFDRVDFVNGQNRFFFRLENRLMAHRLEDGGTPRSWELARFGLAQSLNLTPQTREFSDVFLESLTPERVDEAVTNVSATAVNGFRQAKEQRWSNLVVQGAVSPIPDLTVYSTFAAGTSQVNFDFQTLTAGPTVVNTRFNTQAVNSGVAVHLTDELTVDLGHTFVRGASADGVLAKATWKPLTSVAIDLLSRYDIQSSVFNENGLVIHYATCCWEVRLKWDNRTQGPGLSRNNSVAVSFSLRTPTLSAPAMPGEERRPF
jgi:LPS-assembly protein